MCAHICESRKKKSNVETIFLQEIIRTHSGNVIHWNTED